MSRFLRLLIVSSLSLVVACTPRGTITLFPDAAGVGLSRHIFVGTTRGVDDDGRLNNNRSPNVSYHRYDVSVPPKHEVGEIEWPKRKPDAAKNFLTTSVNHYPAAPGFKADLARSLRSRPKGQREVALFVHGFNNTYAEGIYRLAQLSADMEMPNPSVHFSWPSAGSTLGYGYDRDSILSARDGLEELIKTIRSAGADQILLVGHSMGALLSMETLRQMAISDVRSMNRSISGVILISPDIDVDVFRRQADRIGPLPQPFVIFTSSKDRALRLSARLSGQQERLGTVRNSRRLKGLEIALLDVTDFSEGPTGHFNAATSPSLIKILKRLNDVNIAFRNDPAGRTGLLSGTILTVQQATNLILSATTVKPD